MSRPLKNSTGGFGSGLLHAFGLPLGLPISSVSWPSASERLGSVITKTLKLLVNVTETTH